MYRLLLVGAALLTLVPVAVAAQTVPNADIAIASNTANVKHAHVGQEVTFTIVAIFPDMPSCEYGFVQPGQTRITIAIAQAVNPGAKSATNTACVSSAQPINDPNPDNDCMTSAVKIVGKR